jgi:hypothetical protein
MSHYLEFDYAISVGSDAAFDKPFNRFFTLPNLVSSEFVFFNAKAFALDGEKD